MHADNQDFFEQHSHTVITNHEEVVIVAADQVSTKNTIRITEPLILHANTHYGQPIEFNLNSVASSRPSVEDNVGFHVSFERTLRMPDDNKIY